MDRTDRGHEAGPSGRREAAAHANGGAWRPAPAAWRPAPAAWHAANGAAMQSIEPVAAGSGVGFLQSISAKLQRSHAYVVHSNDEACPIGYLALLGEGLCASLWDKLFSKPVSFKRRFEHTQHAGGWAQLPGRQVYEYKERQQRYADEYDEHDQLQCREFVEQVFEAAHDVACKVVVDLASAAGACKPHVLARMATDAQPHCVLSITCYDQGVAPPSPACAEHMDPGLVSLLITPCKSALQVLSRTGQWQAADVGLGHVAVLPGYTTEFITRGAVRAAQYRLHPHRHTQTTPKIPAAAGAMVVQLSVRCRPDAILDPLSVMGPQHPVSVAELMGQFEGEWPGAEGEEQGDQGQVAQPDAARGIQAERNAAAAHAVAMAVANAAVAGAAAHAAAVAAARPQRAPLARAAQADGYQPPRPAAVGVKRQRDEERDGDGHAAAAGRRLRADAEQEGQQGMGEAHNDEYDDGQRQEDGYQNGDDEEGQQGQYGEGEQQDDGGEEQQEGQQGAAGDEEMQDGHVEQAVAEDGVPIAKEEAYEEEEGEEEEPAHQHEQSIASVEGPQHQPKQEPAIDQQPRPGPKQEPGSQPDEDYVRGTITCDAARGCTCYFRIRRHELFQTVLPKVAPSLHLYGKQLTFRCRGMRVTPDQTPADHGMEGSGVQIVATIEQPSQPSPAQPQNQLLPQAAPGLLSPAQAAAPPPQAAAGAAAGGGSQPFAAGSQSQSQSQQQHITLTVQDAAGDEVMYKLQPNTKLQRIHEHYCERQHLDPASVAFQWAGATLELSQTAGQLGLQDGDVLRTHVAAEARSISFSVRNQQGHEVFFKVKGGTKLGRVFDAYCDKQGLDPRAVRFIFAANRLQPDDTPMQLAMGEGAVIEATVVQLGGGGRPEQHDPAMGASQAASQQAMPKQRLVVRGSDRPGSEIDIHISRDTPFARLFDAYAQHRASGGRSPSGRAGSYRFMFDGAPLQPWSTPRQHSMEDGDVIDAVPVAPAVGGAARAAVKQEAAGNPGAAGHPAGNLSQPRASAVTGRSAHIKQEVVASQSQPRPSPRQMPSQQLPSVQSDPGAQAPGGLSQPHGGLVSQRLALSQPHGGLASQLVSHQHTLELGICDATGTMTFKMKPATQFQKMFDLYCSKRGITDIREVRFTWRRHDVEPGDTPASLGMRNGDVLQAAAAKVTVTLLWQGNSDQFRIEDTTTFITVIMAFCAKHGTGRNAVQMWYKGGKVQPQQQPRIFGVRPGGTMTLVVTA